MKVHFTETFDGETVQLRLGESDWLTFASLRTDPRTGLARSVDVPASSHRTVLHVALSPDGQASSLEIDPGAIQHVTVELDEDGLRLTPLSKADYRAEPRGFA